MKRAQLPRGAIIQPRSLSALRGRSSGPSGPCRRVALVFVTVIGPLPAPAGTVTFSFLADSGDDDGGRAVEGDRRGGREAGALDRDVRRAAAAA